MMYMNHEHFSLSSLICELTKQAGDQITVCAERSVVLPWHFVYSDLWGACLLFFISTTFISRRRQCCVLTCLTDTMGVFSFYRVSLVCKAVQINPPREEFWPLPQPVSLPSSQPSLSGSGRRTTTSCRGVIPAPPPSSSKTMISLPKPGIRWLFEIPSTMLDWAPLLFPIDTERGGGKQNDRGRKYLRRRPSFGPYSSCFKFQSVTTKPL